MPNIGRIVVKPATKTSISAPSFTPRANVSITDIQRMNISYTNNGDTLVYDSASGEFKSGPIDIASLKIDQINGGSF